jgi:hypothetical protein
MDSRTTVRHVRETGLREYLKVPFPTSVWNAERAAFADVADGLALAHVALAYHDLASLERIAAVDPLGIQAASDELLPSSEWLKVFDPRLSSLFESIEQGLTQLDRYSRLAKGPVDYSKLTSGSG